MRTNKPSPAFDEDGLSTEDLSALVSVPGVWDEAGSADEVCDRVTQRLRETAR